MTGDGVNDELEVNRQSAPCLSHIEVIWLNWKIGPIIFVILTTVRDFSHTEDDEM